MYIIVFEIELVHINDLHCSGAPICQILVHVTPQQIWEADVITSFLCQGLFVRVKWDDTHKSQPDRYIIT